jgi:GT2 family glycosyltransferase
MAQVGIAIGLPFGGRLVHPKWAVALKTVDFPVNTTQTVICVEGQDITSARNTIVKTALEQNCKYLFFLDDDVLIPRHTIQGLGHILDNGVDENVMVATGIYCTKTYSPAPVIYRDNGTGAFLDWRVNEIFDIDSAGAGCMMINTDVFKSLEAPYFRTEEGYKPDANGDNCLTAVSEDIYFCKTVREKGFKIKAHGAILCAHYDNVKNKFHTLPEDSLPVKRELARQQKEIDEKELVNG